MRIDTTDVNDKSIAYPCSLYPLAVIRRATKDYRAICNICIDAQQDVTICTFVDNRAPLAITMGEFSNYLLELLHAREGEAADDS